MAYDDYDTHEASSLAQNDEYLYAECDRIAKTHKRHFETAKRLIRSKIIASGILKANGIRQTKVDWDDVTETFTSSV